MASQSEIGEAFGVMSQDGPLSSIYVMELFFKLSLSLKCLLK